jgi:hypothetical protein
MYKLSKITLAVFSCLALTFTKQLPSLAFTSSDLDASNDSLASLAVPLKMLRFSSQDSPNTVADESFPSAENSSCGHS